jgi:hypothetical protein
VLNFNEKGIAFGDVDEGDITYKQLSEGFAKDWRESKIGGSVGKFFSNQKVDPASVLNTIASGTYKFMDAEGKSDCIEGTWFGSGSDTGDKGLYKAITGGIKYVLNTNFLIPTGDDPEKDDDGNDGQTTSTTKPDDDEAQLKRELIKKYQGNKKTATAQDIENAKAEFKKIRSAQKLMADMETAEKAETFGTLALLFGILSPLVLSISGVAALILWDLMFVYIGLIAAIVVASVAIVFAIISLTSTYNTKRGRRSSIVALIWAIPLLFLSSLVLVFLIGSL